MILGIAGGSGSGKTTLAQALSEATGAPVVSHDAYYKTLPDAFRGDRIVEYNFDHPDSLDSTLLLEHLDALASGAGIDMPTYDFANCRRAVETVRVEPGPLVIVEGILVLAIEALRSRFDRSVYVRCSPDVRLARRLQRDVVERGDAPEPLLKQYFATVRPMHRAFVLPSERFADLTLDGESPVDAAVAAVRALL